MWKPTSCDTFAVLPPGTAGDCIVFGKNSDRPSDEVQEIVYAPAAHHLRPSKVQCTYIAIDQVEHTHAVVLSKPSWMWGAEMGANEHGVCIGNEAVWTKLDDKDEPRLLGMDLLRLGLERSTSAIEALEVITSLLEAHGQGGNCSNTLPNFTYHNSFLIADPVEVWILETAGRLWAAERVVEGVRNISNDLSIGSKIDRMSNSLIEESQQRLLWDPKDGPFDFRKVFGLGDDSMDMRYSCGKRLLKTFSSDGQFKDIEMFKVLRDKPSGICMSSGSFVSTGSQVSVLRKTDSKLPCVHWFTGTPDPSNSVFKPFIFMPDIEFPFQIVSPEEVPTSESKIKCGKHILYRHHENTRKKNVDRWRKRKMELESYYIGKIEQAVNDFPHNNKELLSIFKTAVEDELKLYAE